jgi:hypothetical protein
MLRACVLNDCLKWDQHLSLAEFYNNNYQENIKMSPFKVVYGWPYRTPLSWSESSDRVVFGPDIMTEVEEKVKQIRANILIATLTKDVTPPRIWCWWLRIPSSFTDERCMSFQYQRKASSPLHYSISHHWEVWTVVQSTGVTFEAIRSLQRVSCLPIQKMYEAPN